jgi:outer membrane lipoprotein carrier protein
MRALAPLRPGGLLLAAAFIAQALLAQAPALSAKQLAARVDRHYNHLRTLQTAFTETYQGMGMERTDSGTLLLEKPGRMKWEYDSPPGKIFLLDGKYAWFYTPGDAQVERISARHLNDLRSPLRYLLGHTELEKEISNLTMTPAPGGCFTLAGQPKDAQNRIAHVALIVTARGVITGISIKDTGGALTRFTFTHEQPGAAIPAGTFHFTPPPGVPVVNGPPPV